MDCPDIDRLVDLTHDHGLDLPVRAHVRACPECQQQLRVIDELRQALRDDIVVPERLLERTFLATVPAEATRDPYSGLLQGVSAAALGTATALATVVATGSASGARPLDVVLFSLAFGGLAALYEFRRDESGASREPDRSGRFGRGGHGPPGAAA